MSKWLTKKLQSSLEARSTDPVKAYEELGDGILKFESLNILPVPMEVGELSGGEALGISLLNHSAKFYKTCQLKFGNEKLEKEIKWHKKQDNFGTLEMHSTLKGISWSYGLTQSSLCPVSISIFFFILMILLVGHSLKIVELVLWIFLGLLGSKYFNFFEILMIKRSFTWVYLPRIL